MHREQSAGGAAEAAQKHETRGLVRHEVVANFRVSSRRDGGLTVFGHMYDTNRRSSFRLLLSLLPTGGISPCAAQESVEIQVAFADATVGFIADLSETLFYRERWIHCATSRK